MTASMSSPSTIVSSPRTGDYHWALTEPFECDREPLPEGILTITQRPIPYSREEVVNVGVFRVQSDYLIKPIILPFDSEDNIFDVKQTKSEHKCKFHLTLSVF
ncbi:unnamed protein product [Angiostrongylus costaricensis]|uniref:Uncharacterized protein n=1 Tax=Angiostrongylus costaricensis TaxID=334426 RepID=A0A0R3PXY3_ANGCS|nr:unnamed protein product [Angiostrongylus costaricensis]